MRLTEIAQKWLAEVIREGDVAVDATLGNGADALFLAKHIGETGILFGFDVQKQAIEVSQALLGNQPCQQFLFLTGHEAMRENIPERFHGHIKAVMFNLGWLPNSDKSIITKADTTMSALKQSLDLLTKQGRMTVMVYPGHQGGDTEAEQVMLWLEQACIHPAFTLNQIILPNSPTAPILLQVTKL